MKRLFALAAAIAAIGIFAPSSASAYDQCYEGSRRIVGYQSCGTPIYAVYHVHGYDSCGRPMGHWVTQQPAYCPPPRQTYCPPPSCPPPGYGRSSHSRATFPIPIPPHHRAGFSVFFGR